jgi:hypothetical protein
MGHAITVPSTFPLKEVFGNKEANGRITKLVIELAPFSVTLTGRTAIKSHVLLDFVAEWQALPMPPKEEPQRIGTSDLHWNLRFDGSECLNRAGADVVPTSQTVLSELNN